MRHYKGRIDLAGATIGATKVVKDLGDGRWECICTICGQVFARRHKKLLEARGSATSSCGECLVLVARGARRARLEAYHEQIGTDHERRVLRVFRRYQREAKRRGLGWALSMDDIHDVIFQPCTYCGAVGPSGIDRINNDSYYVRENIQPCCWTCNRAKGSLLLSEWEDWRKRVAA